MLEGLDQFDWSRLSHAYGDASDVPDLIRRLGAGSVETSREALHELFGNIWHQGTVYQATAVAVPFLLELVEDPATPDRSGILDLLQSISDGWLIFQRYAVDDGKFVPPEIAARHARERPHYQAAHEAVAKGFDVLVRLLSDEDRAVRAGSAFVLATLTERSSDVATTLLDTIDDETDDWCRGALLLALLVLVQNAADPAIADVAVRRFELFLDEKDLPFAALGAGIALLRLNRAAAVPRVLDMARPRLVEDMDIFVKVPWHETGELYSLMARSLNGMPRQRLRWIVEGLNHADQQVRSSAMYCGSEFCAEYRWGPAELAPYFAKLAGSADAQERTMAIRRLRGLGARRVDHLQSFVKHPAAEVRAEATEQLERVAKTKKERESWLVERRPFLLPSVNSLIKQSIGINLPENGMTSRRFATRSFI
ncbi:MAG TPA: hypothetical protein VMP01_21120 [Pirellulaceae bacterium]|nr:hypothetical protein [Pirellulaceae bacterium]